jgi:hypothetical protein
VGSQSTCQPESGKVCWFSNSSSSHHPTQSFLGRAVCLNLHPSGAHQRQGVEVGGMVGVIPGLQQETGEGDQEGKEADPL